jgi:Icc-related predicted phosphoesterase
VAKLYIMRVVAFSDSHSYHRQINMPDGDLLICAGDITFRGELPIMEDFCNWLKELPHKHKICIFGNHETGMEYGYKRQPALNMIRDSGAIYLENSMTEIDGYKIYGSPVSPEFFHWEWNRKRGKEIAREWSKIPENTNILITHGPPYGILDLAPRGIDKYSHEGCEDLLNRIGQLKDLKLWAGGHIHRDNNEPPIEINGIKFCNASVLNNKYELVNDPIIIEI